MTRSIFAALAFVALTLSLPAPLQAQPAARVGSWTLNVADIDAKLAHQIHELREEKMQEMVLDRLMQLEADATGIAKDNLIEEVVVKKIPPLSDEDVKAFVEANKARLPNGGEGMDDKIRDYLNSQLRQNLEAAFLQSLAQKYKVEFLLQPPRVTVPGPQDLAKGRTDAPITIIEFSDFECPYCRRAQESLKQVAARYGDKVRFVFRHYPLPFHKKAPKASEAAQCANDQGAFWPFHDALFTEGAKLEINEYKKIAVKLKLNSAKFNKCLDSGRYAKRVASDLADGKELGITGTPTFFVNGIKLVGAVPLSDFINVIEPELAR